MAEENGSKGTPKRDHDAEFEPALQFLGAIFGAGAEITGKPVRVEIALIKVGSDDVSHELPCEVCPDRRKCSRKKTM